MIDEDHALIGLAGIVETRAHQHVCKAVTIDVGTRDAQTPYISLGPAFLARREWIVRIRQAGALQSGGAPSEDMDDPFTSEATGELEARREDVVKAVAIDVPGAGKVLTQVKNRTLDHDGIVAGDERVCIGGSGGGDPGSTSMEDHEPSWEGDGLPGGEAGDQDVIEAIAIDVPRTRKHGIERDGRIRLDLGIRVAGMSPDDSRGAAMKDQHVAPRRNEHVVEAVVVDIARRIDVKSQ